MVLISTMAQKWVCVSLAESRKGGMRECEGGGFGQWASEGFLLVTVYLSSSRRSRVVPRVLLHTGVRLRKRRVVGTDKGSKRVNASKKKKKAHRCNKKKEKKSKQSSLVN